MVVYFIAPVALLLLDKLDQEYLRLEKRGLEYLFLVFAAFILCGGYMTGSDWRSYELLYDDITIRTVTSSAREWLFYLYMLAFKMLGVGFFNFLIFTKIVVFIEITRFFIKYSRNDFFPLFFFLSYSTFSLFLFVDNPLRFMIAYGIVLLAFENALNNKPLKFAVLLLMACLFHISAIIILPAYFIKRNKLSKLFLIVAYSIFFFGFSTDLVLSLLSVLSSFIPALKLLLWPYILSSKAIDNSVISIGSLFNYFLFIFIVNEEEKIECSPYGQKVFALTIVYFILFKIGIVFATAFRLALYFVPFLILSLSIAFAHRGKVLSLAKGMVVLYLLLSLYQNVYNSWAYYPYSNYLFSRIPGEKDYIYRSDYNKDQYKERFGKYPETIDYSKLREINDAK